jgi:excisionase family DNA binding protein
MWNVVGRELEKLVGEHDVLTAEEAAAYLRIARATLYRLAAKGEIPAVKVGRVWRFSRQLLDEWIEARMRANLESRSQEGRGREPALSEPVLSKAERAEGGTDW